MIVQKIIASRMKVSNYNEITFEKIQSLAEGFYLSYTSEKKVLLTIKSTAGLITSLVNGCQISLALSKSESLLTLHIYDHPANPLYFKDKGFSNLDEEFVNFESIVIDLLRSTCYKLIILNETNYQIASVNITKLNYIDIFKDWLKQDNDYLEVQLSNISFNAEKKIIYIDSIKNSIWKNKLIHDKPYFNFDEYTKNGTHGYLQEFSIRNILSVFYEPNIELFSSVKKTNNEELTDFLIYYNKAILVIESKYTISSKQTNFNNAISKAIDQLNKAEQVIVHNPELINHSLSKNELLDFQVILKLCVFYDDGRELKKAFKNIRQNHQISALPIFISISTFNRYMAYAKSSNEVHFKYNIIENLLRIRIKYRKQNEMIVIDGFDINNKALTFTY